MAKTVTIPVARIRINEEFGLRKVNLESEEFQGLIESIKEKDFITAITVRPYKGDPNFDYELIDGLQRLTAMKMLARKEIPAVVVEMGDQDVLLAQIMTNIHRVETRPVEYTQQLKRIMAMNPTMTVNDLAKSLGRTPQWIQNRLSIEKIVDPDIQVLVNTGKINIAAAYALAKLPPEEQASWVPAAVSEQQQKFIADVDKRVAEIRNERRKGREAGPPQFVPSAHLRNVSVIKTESQRLEAFKVYKPATPEAAWKAAIEWVLNLDPQAVAEAKAKWDKQRQDVEAAKKAKAEERAKKKAAEAQAQPAEVKA